MTRDGDELAERLESFRNYLMVLARSRLDPGLRGKVDPADLVQQTLTRAYQKRDLFHGEDDAHRAAWLRKILSNVLVDAMRKLGPIGGERERSLEASIEQSSLRLERFLVADQSSPSQRAMRNERLLALADALTGLPEDQRRAVELRHLHGASLVEIAQTMDRSVPAAAGLIQRGLRALRCRMEESAS
jgi:RNA polymerase sigma-70 factor (ECF subfamily)